jgi:methyltransferase (TIGR00027 family)
MVFNRHYLHYIACQQRGRRAPQRTDHVVAGEQFMEESVASVTAMSTARMRAIHTQRDPQPVLDDPWGDRLVPASLFVSAVAKRSSMSVQDSGEAQSEELARIADDFLHENPAFTNVVLRARYAEDALRAAIAGGVRQYVLLGAGFDSYALRMPPEASDVTIIEIDHPATQSFKRERIAACGLVPPGNLQFVAADLAREGLDEVLARSAFRRDERAFFAWLGVTMYLTREANIQTLRAIARCSRAGSELVFSYIDQKVFDARNAPAFDELEKTVQSFGEPFICGFYPATLGAELQAVGLDLVEDLNEFQMAERFDPRGVNGLQPLDRSHVALARVRAGSPA